MSVPRFPSDQPKPILYEALYHRATMQLQDEVEQRLASEAGKAAHQAAGWVMEALRQAYTRGVADGFAQGVAAEARPAAADPSADELGAEGAPNPGEAA